MNKLCKKVQIVLLMVATVALQMQAGAPPSRGKKRTRTTRMQSPRTIQKEVTKAAGTAGKASSELDLIVVELSNIIDIVVNKKRSTTTTVSDLANSKKEANRLMRNLDSKVANLIRDDFNTIVKLALKSSDENKANAKESFDSILEVKDSINKQSLKVASDAAKVERILAAPPAERPQVIAEVKQEAQAEEEQGYWAQAKGYGMSLKNLVFGEEMSVTRAALYTLGAIGTAYGTYQYGPGAYAVAKEAYTKEGGGFGAVPGALYEAGKVKGTEAIEWGKAAPGRAATWATEAPGRAKTWVTEAPGKVKTSASGWWGWFRGAKEEAKENTNTISQQVNELSQNPVVQNNPETQEKLEEVQQTVSEIKDDINKAENPGE